MSTTLYALFLSPRPCLIACSYLKQHRHEILRLTVWDQYFQYINAQFLVTGEIGHYFFMKLTSSCKQARHLILKYLFLLLFFKFHLFKTLQQKQQQSNTFSFPAFFKPFLCTHLKIFIVQNKRIQLGKITSSNHLGRYLISELETRLGTEYFDQQIGSPATVHWSKYIRIVFFLTFFIFTRKTYKLHKVF